MAIATILSQTPDIYLLDEPVNHLDLRHQLNILQHFRQLASKQQKAVVMTLHDINLAARYCDTVLLLYGDGPLLHGQQRDVLTEANLSQLFDTPVTQILAGGHTVYIT